MNAMLARRPLALAGVLFAEDFDDATGVMVIEAPPEPEVIAPAFNLADLESIREQARSEGQAAALADVEAARSNEVRAALAAIRAAIEAAAGEQAAMAVRQAEAVARLLLETLMILLPALCARHAEAEVRAVARAVLPALKREPSIVVRTRPDLMAAIQDEIERLDPELAARIELVPADGMAPGDVRVSWAAGAAVRDTSAVWKEIEAALAEAGLRTDADTREDLSNGG